MKELSQIAASLADLYARWLPYRARGAFPLGCSSGFLVCPRKRCNYLVIKYNNMRCWPNISVKMVGPGPNVDLKLGHFCCPCLWSWCHLPTANLQFIQRYSIVHFNIVSERLPLSTEFKPLTIKQRFLMSLTSNVSCGMKGMKRYLLNFLVHFTASVFTYLNWYLYFRSSHFYTNH